MNDKGEKAGNPVKASRIGKSVGYEAVQRRMEKSGEAIRNGKLKERTRKIVATAMQTARSRKELEQQLKKQGIDVVFRQNDSGRIYGVTFIEHDSRVVLNGSRLGKEYSANVFNERFSGETGKMYQRSVSTAARPAHASGTAGLHAEIRHHSGRGFRAGNFRRIVRRRCIRR